MDPIIVGIIVTVVGGLLLAFFKRRLLPGESHKPKQAVTEFEMSLERGHLIDGNASIFLEGKHIGSVSVGPLRQSSVIRSQVSRPGRFNYSVQGNLRATVYDQTGARVPVSFASNGAGVIDILPGKRFTVSLNNLTMEGGASHHFASIDPEDRGTDDLEALRDNLQEILDDLEEEEIIGGAELLTFLDDNYKRLGMSQTEYQKLTKSAAVEDVVRWLRKHDWVT